MTPKRTSTGIRFEPQCSRVPPCRDVVKDSMFTQIQSQKPDGRNELYALQAQKHWRATHSSRWIARSYADRSGAGHCRVCKNRWRTPEGDVVAREFGDNDAARTLSRKRSKSEQGEPCHPLPTETVDADECAAFLAVSGICG